jgi:hypothetical protein
MTCEACKDEYKKLTDAYVDIQNGAGDQICMDIVDTVRSRSALNIFKMSSKSIYFLRF